MLFDCVIAPCLSQESVGSTLSLRKTTSISKTGTASNRASCSAHCYGSCSCEGVVLFKAVPLHVALSTSKCLPALVMGPIIWAPSLTQTEITFFFAFFHCEFPPQAGNRCDFRRTENQKPCDSNVAFFLLSFLRGGPCDLQGKSI